MSLIVPVIGGGPAGMSCALWLHNYALQPIIIERERVLGGMAARNPYPNPWLLGSPTASGRENAEQFAWHVRGAGVECWLGAQPGRLDRNPDGAFDLVVDCTDGPPRSLICPAIAIATGTEFRGSEWLDRVGNARHLAAAGRVHVGPAWAREPGAELGSHLAIIGGGDNAFDVADALARKGIRATIVLRARQPRAQPRLIAQARAHAQAGLARVLTQCSVETLEQAGNQIRLRLSDGGAIEVDHVLLLLGYQPNTKLPWLAGLALAEDANGYLMVDGNMETSCRGVFAVGDVANPVHPCIATALASGTMAAREIQKRLGRETPPSST